MSEEQREMLSLTYLGEFVEQKRPKPSIEDLRKFFEKEKIIHDQVYGRKALPTPGQKHIDTRTPDWKAYAKRLQIIDYLQSLAAKEALKGKQAPLF